MLDIKVLHTSQFYLCEVGQVLYVRNLFIIINTLKLSKHKIHYQFIHWKQHQLYIITISAASALNSLYCTSHFPTTYPLHLHLLHQRLITAALSPPNVSRYLLAVWPSSSGQWPPLVNPLSVSLAVPKQPEHALLRFGRAYTRTIRTKIVYRKVASGFPFKIIKRALLLRKDDKFFDSWCCWFVLGCCGWMRDVVLEGDGEELWVR